MTNIIEPPGKLVQILKQAQNVLVATHVYPDGDALGSQLALGDILTSLGKNVIMYGEEPVTYLYDFLPGSEKINTDFEVLESFDCMVALDCGDKYRLGKAMDQLLTIHPTIMIDHHAGHKLFGDIQWVDPGRAATGEMVYDLAKALGAGVSYDAAYCLYTAIVSDSGSFKYSSTTGNTLHVAGKLVECGVRPSDVAGQLFDNFSVNRLRLMRMVLDSLELHHDDRLALIYATHEMFEITGTIQADTENFINYPRALATVKVAVFIKESPDNGMISVSLRSKGNEHDVAAVATEFGGGGHRNAAGFKVRDKGVMQVRDELLEKLQPLVA